MSKYSKLLEESTVKNSSKPPVLKKYEDFG